MNTKERALGILEKLCFGYGTDMKSKVLTVLFVLNISAFVFAVGRYFILPFYNVEMDYTGVRTPISKIVVRDYRELHADCAHYQAQLINKDNHIASLQTQLVNAETARCDERNMTKQKLPTKIGEDLDPSKVYQVPNIVHYIWYNENRISIKFYHMVSVLSAYKFIKPDTIYFHTNNEPKGAYWDTVKTIPVLKIVKREPPTHLYGEKLKGPFFYTSYSNIDRLKVLMEYGGIYMDFDVFATSSFDDLRKFVCTIGLESDKKACGSVVVASKDSFFLYLWINSYLDDYRIEEWAYNTGQVPFNLAKRYPHLVHVENLRINHPNYHELDVLYGNKTFNWRGNYAVHTWYRLWKDWSGMFTNSTKEPDENNVKTLNNTFGQIVRDVLYATTDLMK